MRSEIFLGPVPAEEECAQVGDPDYGTRARAECQRYIDLLRKKFGPEPEGAKLRAKQYNHDYGSYMEVVCFYDDAHPQSWDYALKLESEGPTRWE